ncbi:MAG: branched-chain amino acid ABC transporter permease [Acidimicrobiia bacterium]|nr:branched-chain amino acid ABC transporter permease [Acidimicrobiia bacterium]MBT8249873.1 branched-chain amino acid ABC transporter permease [Acidimicrobiia bacterium]NNC43574.1 branched-chain amino acid ABC transporter permease [Acidimicrobiia bacterium]NND13796.1 branched-chain amino acid ABC transporter permease [Acidimicrobiia bacterium]NNL28042.1 branched-chain amino acid ABC transporter permease [Acidimicrobiia bacterium]
MIVAQIAQLSTFEEIIQLTLQGLALGAVYALIALGFVIIYKATGVLNFAHGALMLVGVYVTFSLVAGQIPRVWPISGLGQLLPFPEWMSWWTGLHINVRFPISVLLAIVFVALLGMLIERTALRKLVGQPVFAVVLVTLGLELVISTMVQSFWNPLQKAMPTPFPVTASLRIGNLSIQWASVWAIIVMVVVVLGFFAFFKYSKYGVAMRATALDQEAAMAMGIKASTVFGLAWALGGAMAAIAGAMFIPARLAGFISFTTVRFSALNAFPAAILGGLDSPGGAVVGGLGIGVAQVLSTRYLNPVLADLPVSLPNFHLVFPYVLMLLVLLVRPYGLFGTEEVRRV